MVALSKMEVGMLDPCLRGDISVSLEALKPYLRRTERRERLLPHLPFQTSDCFIHRFVG